MAKIHKMRDYNGAQFYPEVHEKAVVDSNGVTLDTKLDAIVNRSSKEAWDGDSTPVVAEIPAGVVVTYNSQSYTGTLAASAATAPFIYMVADGNGNYDRYVSELSGSSYVWKYYGNTEIDLADYTTKEEFGQLKQEAEELEAEGYTVDLSVLKQYSGQVEATAYGGSAPSYTHINVPVTPGDIVKVMNGSSRAASMGFITEIGERPDNVAYVQGGGRITLGLGLTSYNYIVPVGAKYLAITDTYGGNDVKPASVKIYRPTITSKVPKKPGQNLFDGTLVSGARVVSGTLEAASGQSTTNPIAVKPNTNYSAAYEASTGFRTGAFLNSAMKVISYFNNAAKVITTPADCAYVVLTFYDTELPIAMVCESADPQPYVAYDPIGGYAGNDVASQKKLDALKKNVDGILYDGTAVITGEAAYQQNIILARGYAETGKSIKVSVGETSAPQGETPRVYFRTFDSAGNRIRNNDLIANTSSVYQFTSQEKTFEIRFFATVQTSQSGEIYTGVVKAQYTDSLDYRLSEIEGHAAKHNVLWSGDSIPESSPYPQGACGNLGYSCQNKSLGSSGICITTGWAGDTGRDGKDLSETVAEKEARYRQYVTSGAITEERLATYKSWSWENRIKPYINGTLDNCDIVVFNYGYNDRAQLASELATLDSVSFDTDLPDESYDRTTFVGAFCYLVKQIWKINPEVKIMICSYLENVSGPSVHSGIQIDQMLRKLSQVFNFPYLNMCDYNDFSYARIPDSSDYISGLNTNYGTSFTLRKWDGYTGNNVTRYQYYCPDGIHPHSDPEKKGLPILIANVTKLLRDVF